MPITSVRQITPLWLTHVLNRAGIEGIVTRVRIESERKSGTSRLYLLTIRYTLEPEQDDHMPARLILKVPDEGMPGLRREAIFYSEIAPVVLRQFPEFPIPRCFHGGIDPQTGHSHLLLEAASPEFHSYQKQQTPRRGHYEKIIDGLAMLHATWWEHRRLKHVGQLLQDHHIDAMITKTNEKLQDFFAYMGEALSHDDREKLRFIVSRWPERRRERIVNGQGLTLVHRDTHPNNFLYGQDGESALILDWDAWRVDTGTDDLAYMMACHWDATDRAYDDLLTLKDNHDRLVASQLGESEVGNPWADYQTSIMKSIMSLWDAQRQAQMEIELLRHYHARLVEYGVMNYTWDDCWYDYRASIIRCIAFLVTAFSVPNWQTGTWWARIQRAIAAYERYDCESLL